MTNVGRSFRVTWDLDPPEDDLSGFREDPELFTSVFFVPSEIDDDDVPDWLSDQTGWLVLDCVEVISELRGCSCIPCRCELG